MILNQHLYYVFLHPSACMSVHTYVMFRCVWVCRFVAVLVSLVCSPLDPVVQFAGGPLTASESDEQLEVTLSVEKLEGIPINLTFTYKPTEGQGRSGTSDPLAL